MERREELIVTGYLIAREEIRASEHFPAPEAFPFDRLPRFGLNLESPPDELGLVTASFAHYVREREQVPSVRQLQMQHLAAKLANDAA